MKSGNLVKLTKINTAQTPVVASCVSDKLYEHGVENDTSPYTGYTLKGYLLQDITVGKGMVVDRISRNGVSTPGLFTSSVVESIDLNNMQIFTANSVYKIEPV